jgi:serine protease
MPVRLARISAVSAPFRAEPVPRRIESAQIRSRGDPWGALGARGNPVLGAAGRSVAPAVSARAPLLPALAGAVAIAGFCAPDPAAAAPPQPPYRQGEVVVRYQPGTARSALAGTEAERLPGGAYRLKLPGSAKVRDALARLRRNPRVTSAVPNYTAHMSGLWPNDPGFRLQWNFMGPFGIGMPAAWQLAGERTATDDRDVTVAVLDTGVAYADIGPLRRAPDLRRFVPGYDFVDDDPYPFDLKGHGTHIAGTIAEATNNGIGATGIADQAQIMPVRTLDAAGIGDAVTISRGIRYAVRHHADVINMSLEFGPSVDARDIPEVLSALRYARRKGVVVVTVAGNEGRSDTLPYPGRSGLVIAVSATTASGCQAAYSNAGDGVDVAAPGGGPDATPRDDRWDREHCRPATAGPSIYQETLGATPGVFDMPSGYYGTSMAAAHVAGLAALLIATRPGPRPRPSEVQRLIERSARDIGPAGYDTRYGHGLIDAAAALRATRP